MNRIVFFDLETTGTSISKDRIVQISAVETDLNLNVLSPIKNILINPTIPIPKEASDVHKITDEMVKDKATFDKYAKSMLPYFSDCILGGFNIKRFDIPLLAEEFARCGIDLPLKDRQVVDCYNIFAEKEPRNLSAAFKFYTGDEMQNAHDAEADTTATVSILKGQLFMYNESIEQLINICKNDDNYVDFAGKIITIDGNPCYSFGKHKGKKVLDYTDFAYWMLREDFPLETKNVIKKILNGSNS